MDNLLGSRKLPQVELNEDELSALSDLGKVDVKKGLSFNPYSNIDPEFLKLTDEDNDDDWLYLSEDQKPRERSGHIFNMVGSAGLAGGLLGVSKGLSILKRKNFLNIKSLKHPIKRSEMITNIVTNIRDTSAKCSTFAFVTSMSWAFLDKWVPVDPKVGSAIGGAIYGMSPFLHRDMTRSLPILAQRETEWLQQYGRAPRIWQINNYVDSKILNRCRNKAKVPTSLNMLTGFGRMGLLAATAFTITSGMEWAGKQKGFIRDIKRWKW